MRLLGLKSPLYRQHWSDDESQTARDLHGAGACYMTIARALPGRSVDAVQQKLEELAGPSPFRSARCRAPHAPSNPEASLEDTVPAQVPAAEESQTAIHALLSPARSIIRLVIDSQSTTSVAIPASVYDMVRWLRSRDYAVLHQPDGWRVDRHCLETEAALLEFTNVRRVRLNLPPFARIGNTGPVGAVADLGALPSTGALDSTLSVSN